MAKPDMDAEFRESVASRLDRLRRLAYLMCGGTRRAEDAVQSALTRLYAVWHRTKLDSADAYVRRIVINAVRSEHRRAWFRREQVTDLPPERSQADANATFADRLAVLDALAHLPRRQRAVIVLRFWEDRSVRETAKILRCSEGTVKSQSARGIKALRPLLAEEYSNRQGLVST